MKEKLIFLLLVLSCFLLQCTFMDRIAIGSITPNLLIVLCVSMGLIRGRKSGLWTGFFCGALMDLFFSSVPGLYALGYMYAGFFCGYAHREYYDDDIKVPLVLAALADFCMGIAIYALAFLLRGRQNLFVYLRRIILPEVFYTVLLTLFAYRPLRAFIRRFIPASWKERDSIWVIK